MSLQSVKLDDLTWREMVQAIRERIASVSGEKWTLHAAVDPGVTLLELYAYLLEQRLYWMDQVPDALLHAMTSLLGAEALPAQTANTVFELSHNQAGAIQVPAELVYSRFDMQSPIRFTCENALSVLPVERIDIISAFGESSARMDSQPRWASPPLTLLPADNSPAEFRITLWFREALSATAGAAPFALFIELETSSQIPAQWSSLAVDDVAAAAEVQWYYNVAGNPGRNAISQDDLNDGSQGFRRSGVIRFNLPDHASPAWTPAGPAVAGLVPYHLFAKVEHSDYSSPVRLRRLIPNTSLASHQAEITVPWPELQQQVAEWLPLPGLILQLNSPAPALESSVQLRLRERDGQWHDWSRTLNFSHHGPEHRVFVVNRLYNRIEFGDGLTGRLPVLMDHPGSLVELSYMAGGGEHGNLGANLQWTPKPQIATSPELIAINPVPARGGNEAETAEQARIRVSAELQNRERAITAEDFELLALETPGVAIERAKAIPGYHPGFPCVKVPGAITVFIVPEVPREKGWQGTELAIKAPVPDSGMLTEVRAQLAERRLLTSEVFVRGAEYREVDISATLSGDPLDKEGLEQKLRRGITQFLDPLAGGADGQGWPFGQALHPSELTHQLQQLSGEDALVERLSLQLAESSKDQAEYCVEVRIEAHQLVVLRKLKLYWRPISQSAEGLR